MLTSVTVMYLTVAYRILFYANDIKFNIEDYM